MTAAEATDRKQNGESDYIMEVNKDKFLDASEPHHWEGRTCNDGSKSGFRTNARLGRRPYVDVCPVAGMYICVCV